MGFTGAKLQIYLIQNTGNCIRATFKVTNVYGLAKKGLFCTNNAYL